MRAVCACWVRARARRTGRTRLSHARCGPSQACVCVCVYARQGEGAVSRGRRWGGAPLTLSCRHAQANVEAADKSGTTALVYSAQNGHDGCLGQLLAAKVRVRAMRARVTRSAARCLHDRVRVLGASAREEDRAHSSVARKMRSCAEVCVCVPG